MFFVSNTNSHLRLLIKACNRYASIATNTIKTSCPLSRATVNLLLGLWGEPDRN